MHVTKLLEKTSIHASFIVMLSHFIREILSNSNEKTTYFKMAFSHFLTRFLINNIYSKDL